MPARAMWKGILKLGAENIAVKVYSAVKDRTVHFHVLEKATMERIQQQMVNLRTGEPVPGDQIRKGYEVEPHVFVLLSDEELGKRRRTNLGTLMWHIFCLPAASTANGTTYRISSGRTREPSRLTSHLPRRWHTSSARVSPAGSCAKSRTWARCARKTGT